MLDFTVSVVRVFDALARISGSKFLMYEGQNQQSKSIGFLRVVEEPQIIHDSAIVYAGSPHFTLFVKSDPYITGRIVSLHGFICAILGVIRNAQVSPAVIRPYAVFVVNLILRPLSGHDKPSQTVGSVHFSFSNLDSTVAAVNIPRNSSGVPRIPFLGMHAIVSPSENPCKGVVVQDRSNEFAGKIASIFTRHLGKPDRKLDVYRPTPVAIICQSLL